MPRPDPPPPEVLYEDDALLALAKPAGLLTIPDRWDKQADNLLRWVREHIAPDAVNVHRLDRETSGVVLFAKARPALRRLRELFDTRQVRKEYLALVRGRPGEPAGAIDAPLAPDPRRRGAMRVDPRGKASCTEYEQLDAWPASGYALLRARPLTGRTHQVRVHLARLGCPVVGDALYGDGRGLWLSQVKRGYRPGRGGERPLIDRLALHAERLALPHPADGRPVELTAPPPKDLTAALRQLRRHGR